MTFLKLLTWLYTLGLQQTFYERAPHGELHRIRFAYTRYGHTAEALLYLPQEALTYGTEKFPLIIAFHGKSIAGHDIRRLYREGILRQIREGRKITAVHPVDHQEYKFMVLAPLSDNWSMAPDGIDTLLTQVLQRYRADPGRVYLTGYSAGGWSVVMGITDNKLSKRIAAAVPMSPSAIDATHLQQFNITAEANVHSWYFAGTAEPLFLQSVETYVAATNRYKPGLTRFTRHDKGHCCFHDFYTPDYREGGMNIYEWMILFRKRME